MTPAEETARIADLIGRVRHLMPNIESDGHLTITRLLGELLDRIEPGFTVPADHVAVTIALPAKMAAAMSAIAKIRGLRETSTDEASRIFAEECQRIFEETSPHKFGEGVALSMIALNVLEDAENQIFEAVVSALDSQEDLSYSQVIDSESGDKTP